MLALGGETWLFAQGGFKAALYEAALGAIDRQAVGLLILRDVLIAGAAIGSQQDLRRFSLLRGALAGARQPAEFVAFFGCQIDPELDADRQRKSVL